MLGSMSSVLHPVGPEPSPTYWVRRAVVVGAAVLVLAIVIALIVNGTSRGSAVQPNPSPPAAATVAADTPSPTPTTSTTHTPGTLDSESASAEPTGSGSAAPSSSASARSKTSASATPKPSSSPTKKAPTGPTACSASDLRPTLTGKQRVKPKQPNTFALSLINGSGQTCIVTVNSKNFELKIYSGKDRIWSTNDCAAVVKPITQKVAAGAGSRAGS